MISYDGLEALFPVHMDVDYIRVYREFESIPGKLFCRLMM